MTKPKLKRSDSEKDTGGASSQTTSGGGGSAAGKVVDGQELGSAASSQKTTAPTDWYVTEIQSMMHGFGDCQKPLYESACLVEEIVHQQMNSLLLQLADIATSRCARFIGLEDVVFLLRKDKVKLSRLVRFLGFKDMKGSLLKGVEDVFHEEAADNAGGELPKMAALPPKKRVKTCQDFIATVDPTGELLSLFDDEVYDETKHERDVRADVQSRYMDASQYLEFASARQKSFACKYSNAKKFRDWVLKDNLTEMRPNQFALETMNYLAYETVAQIVDLALLVKQDATSTSDNPLSKITASQCFNPGYPSILLHQPSRTTSPPNSPRSSSPQPFSPSASASAPQPSPSSAVIASSKSKLCKPSDSRVTLEVPTSQVIQPSDIREAIRRYWQPVGPMFTFSKVNSDYVHHRLLSC